MKTKKIAFGVPGGALLIILTVLHFHGSSLARAQPGTIPVHKETSFDLLINQPYAVVAPLFGADGERAWGGADWDPHFIFPIPAKDVSGAIFTLEHGHRKMLWITPIFDLAGRHIEHLYVIHDAMVTLIDITFPDASPDTTKVHVVYQRTALAPGSNQHVEQLAAQDATAAQEWQHAIDNYFASRLKH